MSAELPLSTRTQCIISYSYIDDKCVVMWVVKTSNVFFQEFDDGVVNSWHLWHQTCHLDVLNHPEVSLTGLFGRTKGHNASHNHSYISNRRPRMLVLLSGNLLLQRVCSFLADEPLQLSLFDKSPYLLLQVVVVGCVITVVTVEVAILVFRPLIGISL